MPRRPRLRWVLRWVVGGCFIILLFSLLLSWNFDITSTRRFPGLNNLARMSLAWVPTLCFLAILATWLWYPTRRPRSGHCQTCGYDLTGNETGRCPECGAEVPKERDGSQGA
jgi:hypothetical protein